MVAIRFDSSWANGIVGASAATASERTNAGDSTVHVDFGVAYRCNLGYGFDSFCLTSQLVDLSLTLPLHPKDQVSTLLTQASVLRRLQSAASRSPFLIYCSLTLLSLAFAMSDERIPFVQSQNSHDSYDPHAQFCELVGIPPSNEPPGAENQSRLNTLYERATRDRRSQSITHMVTATLSSTLLLTQIIIGATLTAVSYSSPSLKKRVSVFAVKGCSVNARRRRQYYHRGRLISIIPDDRKAVS